MESSEEIKTDLAALQAVVGRRNILFARRVRLDTKQDRIMVITPSKLYFLAAKAPHKVDSSFHLLDIQGMESRKPLLFTVAIQGDKKVLLNVKVAHHEDVDQVVAHILSQLKLNFPLSNVNKAVILSIRPAERQQKIQTLSDNFVNALMDTDVGPCGGFSLSYLCLCDYFGQHSLAEVVWDIDKIYGSHKCTVFDVADFDHLEQRELLPVLATLEYNTWFTKLKCKSLRLGSEVIDVIVKVLKMSQSLEDITLKEIHLSRDHAQRFATALISNSHSPLKKLNLSLNNMEDRGIIHLCGAIASLPHGLEVIKLSSVGMTSKGSVTLANALKNNKYMTTTLTTLDISNNLLKSDASPVLYDYLAKSNVLRKLNLSNTECALDLLFGAMLRGCTQHLQHLNVAGNPFSYKRAKDVQIPPSVQQFFSASLAIKSINLSSTRLPPEAVKAMLLGLLGNMAVNDVDFDLSKNELRSPGIAEIASCITNIKNISRLDLTDNGIDYDVVNLCIALQKNSSVKKFAIGQNFIKARNTSPMMEAVVDLISREDGVIESLSLAESKLRHEALGFIDALGTNTSLLEIDLRGNLIGDEGARLLAKALQINTTLRTIHLDRNGITHKGYADIATALRRNYSLHYIPMPVTDVAQCMKHFGDSTTKALAEIEKLLLRNQSPHRFNPEQSHRLQQSVLLSSIDQNTTDESVVALQTLISRLHASEDDTVKKEVSAARGTIQDADNLKAVLMNLYSNTDSTNNLVKDKLAVVAADLGVYTNAAVKSSIAEMLARVEERCPGAMADNISLQQLKTQLEEWSMIDKTITDDAVLRLAGTQVISSVCKSNLAAATMLGSHLTERVLQNLQSSHINLSLLAREQQESQQKERPSRTKSDVSFDEDSSLAARKAQNRLSMVQQQRTSLLVANEQSPSGKNLKRRPTFHRKPPTKGEVSVDIDIDDASNQKGHHSVPSANASSSQNEDENAGSWDIITAPKLTHLNKARARPARGRKPPSRASNLAHLNSDAGLLDSEDGSSYVGLDPSSSVKSDTPPSGEEGPKTSSQIQGETKAGSPVSPKPAPRPKPSSDKQRDTSKKHKNPLGGIGLPSFLKKKSRSSSLLKETENVDPAPQKDAPSMPISEHVETPSVNEPTAPDDAPSLCEETPPDLPAEQSGARKADELSFKAAIEHAEENSDQGSPSSSHDGNKPIPAKRSALLPGGVGFGGMIMQEMKLKQNKGSPPEITDRPSMLAKPSKERKEVPPKPVLPRKPPSVKHSNKQGVLDASKEKRKSMPDMPSGTSPPQSLTASDNEDSSVTTDKTPRSSSVGSKEKLHNAEDGTKELLPSTDGMACSPVVEVSDPVPTDKTIDEELMDELFPDDDSPAPDLDEEEQLNLRLASFSSNP